MKKFGLFFTLLCCLFIWGCSEKRSNRNDGFKHWIQNNGKIKVLSTTAMIDDLVQQIGKGHIDTITLIQGELDPHSYQLIKGDDEKLAFADIIFYNGLGLEHGASLYHHLEHNSKAIPLGDQIALQDSSHIVYVNEQKDPHIWMDISLWAKTIPVIAQILSQKDPEHSAEYSTNANKLVGELMTAHEKTKQIMQAVPENKRYLITSHDAFNYFTRAYLSEEGEVLSGEWTKRFAAPEGLAPESQLSTTDIRNIIKHMQKYNITLLFPESNVSRDSIKKILQAGREEGLKMEIACCALYGDAMGPPGSDGDTYLKMIIYNAQTIADCMKPEEGLTASQKSRRNVIAAENY
ncbi:MAG: zinc ABC transporter substrate-binding protein [Parachlamydiaceae bacterium]|nr:zinc ABC transporter substrate-binding protein [Parachlamydiaceae bacterium]